MCACMSTSVCVNVFVCDPLYEYLSVCVFVPVTMCVCLSVCVCMYVFVCDV